MIVSLDTSELKKVRIRLDDGGKIKRKTTPGYADTALNHIVRMLGKKKPTRLGVVAGPGAFSATRTGVSLMNALAFGFGVPITSLTKEAFDSSEAIPAGTKPPITVRYGAPPHITTPKKR